MKTRFWIGCGALFVLTLAGCGGSKASLGEDQFCTESAKRLCSNVGPKCAYDTATAATCETMQKAACQARATAARPAGSPREYRPANATKCLDTISAIYSKPQIVAADLDNLNEACARVFQGAIKANDAPCKVDYDCEGSLICDKGLCAMKKSVGMNGACGNAGETCSAGQFCTKPMQAFVCKDRQGLGKACAADQPCLENFRCTGTCEEQLDVGAACAGPSDCKRGALLCDPYRHSCAAQIGFAAGSASCDALVGKTAAATTTPTPDAAAATTTPDAGTTAASDASGG